MTAAQGISCIEDLGISLSLFQIAIGALEQFHGRPGSQITAANAHHDTGIGFFPDLFGSFPDPVQFQQLFFHRQIQPASKFTACPGAFHQHFMGIFHFPLHGQQIRQRHLPPHIGNINANHPSHNLSHKQYHFSLYATAKSTERQAVFPSSDKLSFSGQGPAANSCSAGQGSLLLLGTAR